MADRRFIFFGFSDIRMPDGAPYMRRWRIIDTPWFGVYVQNFVAGDQAREMHSHPCPFASVILRGSYVEETPDGLRACKWFNSKGLGDLHRVARVSGSVWTLFLRGRRTERWGFSTPFGMMHHEDHARWVLAGRPALPAQSETDAPLWRSYP